MANKLTRMSKTAKDIAKKQLKGIQNRKPANAEDTNQKRIATELRQRGYSIIPEYYSQEQCNQVRQEIDRIIETFPDTVHRDDTDSDNRIYGAERVSDLIMPFHNDSFLHQLSQLYLNYNVLNMFTLANRVKTRENNLGSGGGWHRDTVHERQFKTILYLNDVTETTGAFQYMLGSHSLISPIQLIYQYDLNYKKTRFTEEEIQQIEHNGQEIDTLTGAAGTLIIVDTSGIHRGMPIQEGTRYALTNYFFPEHVITEGLQEKFGSLFIDRDA